MFVLRIGCGMVERILSSIRVLPLHKWKTLASEFSFSKVPFGCYEFCRGVLSRLVIMGYSESNELTSLGVLIRQKNWIGLFLAVARHPVLG